MTKTSVDQEDVLLVADDGYVRTLTLNRPARRNALDDLLTNRLAEAIADAEADGNVRALVITGAGTAFCSGGDLKAIASADTGVPRHIRPHVRTTRTPLEMMIRMETPVIGALNGSAVAGGLELALACDLRVSTASAQFGMPEATRGIGAAFGTVMLPRIIPPAVALEMLLTGRYIDGNEALQIGLINRLVDQHLVLAVAQELAKAIAANAPISVRRMKSTVYGTSGMPLEAALAANIGTDPYASADRIEGVRAFVEKREPQWSNR